MTATEQTAGPPRGPLYDLLRLQTDFQEKLTATTLAYLRELQGLIGPVVPGTVVDARAVETLAAAGESGGRAVVEVEIENRQRAYCLVTPMLSPLVSGRFTWLPRAHAQPLLIGPDATVRASLAVDIAKETPPGLYRGTVVLYGLRDGAVPLQVEVRVPPRPAATERPRTERKPAKRTTRAKPRRRAT
ncbi:MAG: hypothetical protein IRY94_03345 [Rhodospirillaceae bacterium]|nr:hypothetical protein [Rhodospirillaceae bacterium]